jgi:two-component system cell cycle sensor histidine kinase/response regulator CckA
MSLSGQKLALQEPQSKVRQLELLLDLTGAISRAPEPSEIYRAAAQGLVSALIADRAAVLIFDQDDVMRFKEWVGLSVKHRAAVEGHITWQRGARDALPITVSDSMQDASLSAFWEVFAQEGIRALAFIPLIANSGLIGKLMLYYNSPHEFQPDELQVAQAIASQVALAAERQVAEAALREKQQRLISIYNTVEDAIFHLAVEPEGQFRFVSVNAAFLRVTGLSQGKVVGKIVNEVIPESSLVMVLGKYRQAIEEKTVVHWEEASDYPTGRLTGEVSVAPVFDDEGTCTDLVGSVHDITQRKRDEAVLRDREERLRASEIQLKDAQRLAKVGSWERRIDIAISQWSDENRRILGVSNDAPANFSTFISCVHPKDREKVLEVDREVRTTGGPREVRYRILRPDGEVRFVHSVLEALRNDRGIAVRIVGASQDITEQVKAGELLRESEERLKNAERLSHVGHWSWDVKSKHVIWSEECFRIFGRPPDYQPSYEEFLKAVLPQDRDLVERAERERLAAKSGTSIEYRIARPDGDVRIVRSVSEVVLDEEGRPVRMFGAVQDITDVRRALEESVARQKLESLGVLASGIAHDFNNLLSGILAEAELVEAEAAGLSLGDEIARIKAVAIRGSEIVSQLMIYTGQDQADTRDSVDLSRLVGEMLGLLKVSISKQAVFETNLDKNLPIVWGNAPQIRQVVMNLVINASEAIEEKEGVIHVGTSRVTVSEGSRLNNAANLPPGEYVQLEVSDTGCGMAEETRAKIFDPFFSTKFAGRGLGLAVVQGIVRDHGGALDLMSTPGHGTTFRVLLSCASRKALGTQSALTSSAGEQSNAATGTILLAEDEEVLRQAVSKMLRKKGFLVLEASDGSVAMDLIRARADDIDVVLLDVTLPGISSRAILEEAARIRPGLKVILTSAYGKETVSSFLGLRVERFIRKPFKLAELVDELQNALSA